MQRLAILLSLALSITSGHVKAAFVTLPEAALDSIYSQQPSFGNTPIDIRFGPVSQIVAPSLLDLGSDAQVNELFTFHVGALNVVNFYFVDSISACGITMSAAIVGCGQLGGPNFVVESNYAAGPFGAALLAHELGHNLGLDHVANTSYLMHEIVDGDTFISVAEVTSILGSQLVQQETSGARFIMINPVLVVAQSSQEVPAPTTPALAAAGLVLLWASGRRKARPAVNAVAS